MAFLALSGVAESLQNPLVAHHAFAQTELGIVPLDAAISQSFIDVRGVGDSAWASLKTLTPVASEMGAALAEFDSTQKILKGDVNFINYESTVATRCNAWYDVDFAFISSPQSIREAAAHGFNLFSLANNHTEDCQSAEANVPGGMASLNHMNTLARELNIQWHGAGAGSELTQISTKRHTVKGRTFKVGFAAVAFQSWDTDNTSRGEQSPL